MDAMNVKQGIKERAVQNSRHGNQMERITQQKKRAHHWRRLVLLLQLLLLPPYPPLLLAFELIV